MQSCLRWSSSFVENVSIFNLDVVCPLLFKLITVWALFEHTHTNTRVSVCVWVIIVQTHGVQRQLWRTSSPLLTTSMVPITTGAHLDIFLPGQGLTLQQRSQQQSGDIKRLSQSQFLRTRCWSEFRLFCHYVIYTHSLRLTVEAAASAHTDESAYIWVLFSFHLKVFLKHKQQPDQHFSLLQKTQRRREIFTVSSTAVQHCQ